MSEDARIKIYKTEYCGYCRMAAQLLDAHGINYEEVTVDDHESRMAIVEKTGWRTVSRMEPNKTQQIGGQNYYTSTHLSTAA